MTAKQQIPLVDQWKPTEDDIYFTNAKDIIIAPISFMLSNIPVLNIDFLLFLTLNTCTSSESANTINAIV